MRKIVQIILFLGSITAMGQEAGIVFEEGFEAGSLKDVLGNWDDSQNAEGMSLSRRCA